MIKTAPKRKKPRVAGPIDPDKLASYVKRIEYVESNIADERAARADIYTEVKASGMKPKMVRKAVKERAKKEEDEAEAAEYELYREALGMPGATYRSVAAKLGIPKSTLHRLVPREKNGTEPPHDADGVITETAEGPPDESCGGGESRPAHSAGNVVSRDEPTPPSTIGEPCRHVGAGVEPGPQEPITAAWPSADADADNATVQEKINAARRALGMRA